MIERELLSAALARVKAEARKPGEESLWEQGMWVCEKECGTAFCYAGWIVKVASEWYPKRIQLVKGSLEYVEVILDQLVLHIQLAAQQLGGLSKEQALLLFAPSNTLHRLEERLQYILETEAFKKEHPEYYDSRQP